MKTSWYDIQKSEQFLLGKLSAGEKLLFEARLLISPALRLNVELQKKIYAVVKAYHRKRLKEELQGLHKMLLTNPSKIEFQQDISTIFHS